MDHTTSTEPQCLYKGALYLIEPYKVEILIVMEILYVGSLVGVLIAAILLKIHFT